MGGYATSTSRWRTWYGAAPPLERKVLPIEVGCPLCGVPAGTACLKVRRHVNWSNGKHTERMDDARLASAAVNALLGLTD